MNKILLTIMALAVCAPAPAAERCPRLDNIKNWDAPNDRTLIVEDYQHNKFKLSLMGHCMNLKFRLGLGFKMSGGSQLTCLARGDYIIQRDSAGLLRCPISKVELYTPEMQKVDGEAAKANGADAP